MNRIGIMQGRLSPLGARAQECPVASWRDEFARAAALRFDLIEWVVNLSSIESNPLLVDPGAVRAIGLDSGVRVASVCADFFVECPLTGVGRLQQDATVELFRRTVAAAAAIGAETVSVPLLERNAVADRFELLRSGEALHDVIGEARHHDVRIAIETDLPASQLVDAIDHLNLSVCFDLGNAVAAGLDIPSELAALGNRIAIVHIKDRTVGGSSVPLGDGGVPFDRAFAALRAIAYGGPMILETPRGHSAVDSAGRNLDFVKQHIEAATPA
jgi:sugar phosphate isomerase/epimerase